MNTIKVPCFKRPFLKQIIMSDVFLNKVAASGILTLDLEKYLPGGAIVTFDLKDYLFMGLILKEKDFREALKNADWTHTRIKR